MTSLILTLKTKRTFVELFWSSCIYCLEFLWGVIDLKMFERSLRIEGSRIDLQRHAFKDVTNGTSSWLAKK